jgi:hypothetical protein
LLIAAILHSSNPGEPENDWVTCFKSNITSHTHKQEKADPTGAVREKEPPLSYWFTWNSSYAKAPGEGESPRYLLMSVF